MSNPTSKVIPESWERYVTTTDEDTPCRVSFDLEAATEEEVRAGLRYCERVTFTLKNPNEQGLPTKEEINRQYGLEDGLCAALEKAKVPARLVARLTFSGQQELVFQTEDRAKFVAVLKDWGKRQEGEGIDLEEDEGWEYFTDVVSPDPYQWAVIEDRRAVDTLLEAGSNANRPHVLQYVFVGEEPRLERVRDALMERGYDVVSGPEESTLVMGVKCKLDLEQIVEHSIACRELAEAQEVDYEGWSAEVVG